MSNSSCRSVCGWIRGDPVLYTIVNSSYSLYVARSIDILGVSMKYVALSHAIYSGHSPHNSLLHTETLDFMPMVTKDIVQYRGNVERKCITLTSNHPVPLLCCLV